MRKSSAPGSEAAWDKWFVQKKTYFGEKVLPQAAKLPVTSGLFKKKVHILRKSSALGSEAARDKWFVQKEVGFMGKSSAPGSEAVPDKWLVRKKSDF